MALHFDYTKCEAPPGLTQDHLTTCPGDDDRWHPIGDAIVWLSMFCDFGKIDDVEDVWKRVALYQTLYGAYLRDHEGKPLYITKEDIALYKGLRTNVITVPFKKWAAKLMAKWVEHKDFDKVAEGQQAAFWISEKYRPEGWTPKKQSTTEEEPA